MDRGPNKAAKAGMSLQERDLRSKLSRLVGTHGLVRGSLQVKGKTCGKSNCRCKRGETHPCVYLAFSEDGNTRYVFVPKHKEAEVRGWIERYQQTRGLLEELSTLYRERIAAKEE